MVSPDIARQLKLFRGLNQEEIEQVSEIAGLWDCARGQLVFKEGDESDVLYVLLEGEMEVTVSAGFLINHPVARIGPGEVFGELAFIDHEPRSATISCAKTAKLLSITRDDFRRLGQGHPHIHHILYKNIARIVAGRLREANLRLRELAAHDRAVAARLPFHFAI